MSGDELRVRIAPAGDGFRVFASGPNYSVTGHFDLPFDDRDLEIFVLRMSGGRRMRGSTATDPRQVTTFGDALFKALFAGPVGELYRQAKADAEREEKSLRVTLELTDSPQLLNVPWEYMYDEPQFLAISRWTPVVRYLELPYPFRPLAVDLPLRVLAMISSPDDAQKLDVEHERRTLEQALAGLIAQQAVELVWLDDGRLETLNRKLDSERFHVFHYIGHGEYDHQREDGVLLLEDDRRLSYRVTGEEIGMILAEAKSFRLAVLNACDGARTSSDDPFAGVATSLVQHRFPAVIAMQFEISDAAAIRFAGDFYWKLADSGVVDLSLAYARRALFASGNRVEWATPVLFMRVRDGRIFDVPEAPVPAPTPDAAAPTLEPMVIAPTVVEPDPVEADPVGDIPEGGRAGGADEPEPPGQAPGGSDARRGRRLPLVAAVVAGLAALGFGIAVVVPGLGENDATPSPPTTTTTPQPPPTRPKPPPPPVEPWSLRTAVPAAILPGCGIDREVPGKLRPLVDRDTGERVRFLSSLACEGPVDGIRIVQYSVAAELADLNEYFQSRLNGAALSAFRPTPERCGEAETASNRWQPAGKRGHRIVDDEGAGRVLCYRAKPKQGGLPRLEWTDTRTLVFGFMEGQSAEALLRWWRSSAGPRSR